MRKKYILDNLVYVPPRIKEPILQIHIEPLPMNDLQKVLRDMSNQNKYYNLEIIFNKKH